MRNERTHTPIGPTSGPSPTGGAARPARPVPAATADHRLDAELRGSMLRLVSDLPRRPSEAFDDIARGKQHPWRYLVRRCREARDHRAVKERDARAAKERMRTELHAMGDAIVEHLYADAPDAPHAA